MRDIKAVYKRVDGAWAEQTAYERHNSVWEEVGSFPTIVPWSTGTDDEIAAIIDAARNGILDLQADAEWAVGDKRTITVSGESIDIAISSFDDYNGCGCVMQFDFVDAMSTIRRFNASANNSYVNSDMCKTYIPNIVSGLPSWIQSRLLEFPVKVSAGGGSSNIVTVTGKLALRSEIEVFGTVSYSKAGEGSQIPYYQVAANRKKKMGHNGSAYGWWLRSPYGNNTFYGIYVRSDGGVESSGVHNNSFAIAPFGCF